MHNYEMHALPSTTFSNIKSLEYLQIVEPTQSFASNLSLGLDNLKELRIIGKTSHDSTMTIPNDFLHDS